MWGEGVAIVDPLLCRCIQYASFASFFGIAGRGGGGLTVHLSMVDTSGMPPLPLPLGFIEGGWQRGQAERGGKRDANVDPFISR